MGLASQIGEREDNVLCSDVRNMLFGPMEFSRRDLAAINIMRGRDNGLPDYNEVRKCHGLPKINSWQNINSKLYEESPEIFDRLRGLYGDLVRQNLLSKKICTYIKFMFSKKVTKIDDIFTVDLILCSKCQIHGEDFDNFCCLLGKHEL